MLYIFLIGVSLSMDAFAISVANGMALRPFRPGYALWMGLYFGFFQFFMPLLGCLLGGAVSAYASTLGPYISFFLLAFIGGKMLMDSAGGGEGEGMEQFSHTKLLAMALATSIDALAAGVSFAFMEGARLLPACGLIGCTTFALSAAGALLGRAIPGVSGKRAGLLGGAVLIALGLRMLAEGVFQL